jgi:GT2 family glycosyltransferase
MRVSVVICTHNRAQLLSGAVETALALAFPPEQWELLIVDNRSSDQTGEIGRQLSRRHEGRVRFVREPQLGLSAARNRGVAEARGELVAFLDDDVRPATQWLNALVEGFAPREVMAVGGPVDLVFDGPLPCWFDPRYLPYLGHFDKGSEAMPLTYNEYPRGGNMAFRREVFERYGSFSRRFGVRGRLLFACEETELCLRIERAGGRLMYAPEARARHLVGTRRLSPSWMRRRFGAQGLSEALVKWRHGGFRALGRGLERTFNSVRGVPGGPGENARLARDCHRRAFVKYAVGAAIAPLMLRRLPAGGRAGTWAPAS